MITHFADLRLRTLSLQGVKQVYGERLQLPIVSEGENLITFRLTQHTTLTFEQTLAPIVPAHFAIQVPFNRFATAVAFIKSAGLLIAKYEDGSELDDAPDRKNLYFRDGDGHILEIICHRYITDEGVLATDHPLLPLYLREVGFPVESVPGFREWLKTSLSFRTEKDQDYFNFVIGGTAHAVVVSRGRPWLPIALPALPPNMVVTFGTPDASFLAEVRGRMRVSGALVTETAAEITFVQDGYTLGLRHTPDLAAEIPARLGLPLSVSR